MMPVACRQVAAQVIRIPPYVMQGNTTCAYGARMLRSVRRGSLVSFARYNFSLTAGDSTNEPLPDFGLP